MSAYYNEYDPYAAQWLRNLIAAGHIASGDVDERSITEVKPHEIAKYTQCHFFAGIGGWSLAARIAGWADDRPLWTGSCPCQPFSLAGKGEGKEDVRHLWPVFFALISARRPDVVMGEQVAAAVGKDWLDGVYSDLESVGYSCGAAVVPACAVDAPHKRDRLWFVAHAAHQRLDGSRSAGQGGRVKHSDGSSTMADTGSGRRAGSGQGESEQPWRTETVGASEGHVAYADSIGQPGLAWAKEAQRNSMGSSAWRDAKWLRGADGKARRVEPSIRLLAHGVPARVGKLRAYGNAIVPQVAAEVIASYMECRP